MNISIANQQLFKKWDISTIHLLCSRAPMWYPPPPSSDIEGKQGRQERKVHCNSFLLAKRKWIALAWLLLNFIKENEYCDHLTQAYSRRVNRVATVLFYLQEYPVTFLEPFSPGRNRKGDSQMHIPYLIRGAESGPLPLHLVTVTSRWDTEHNETAELGLLLGHECRIHFHSKTTPLFNNKTCQSWRVFLHVSRTLRRHHCLPGSTCPALTFERKVKNLISTSGEKWGRGMNLDLECFYMCFSSNFPSLCLLTPPTK